MNNPIFVSALLVLILLILGDGVAALLAARSCWRIRWKAKLALPFAVVMFALSVESMNSVVNHSVNLKGIEVPTAYLVQAFIGRGVKAAATWYLALKLMEGSGEKQKLSKETASE
jgi:hypothetical protein